MRIGIAYNQPPANAGASDLDVLVQRDTVAEALVSLGHQPVNIPCTLNLSVLPDQLSGEYIDCVFNLVESLAGSDRLQVLVPLLLDSLQIPYTGTCAAAMLSTSDKVTVKKRMRELGLPTADWVDAATTEAPTTGQFIIKARFEHASAGMDDTSVVSVSSVGNLKQMLRERSAQTGYDMFAEQFVEGREFNISVIAGDQGEPRVLAPAEIDFSGFPAGKPRIIGHAAKWAENSFEFSATPRRFGFCASDRELLEKLTTLSQDLWNEFALGGYVRIDYRVDRNGEIFVLEINTNPCLSPDAGFAAAIGEHGHTMSWAIEQIIGHALRTAGRSNNPPAKR